MIKKETHTLHDVEGLILEKLDKLRDSKDKVEQRKLRAEILRLEKHHKDCNDKYTNGHKYPERMKGFPDDKPMDQKELNKLIDSVPDMDFTEGRDALIDNTFDRNLEGVYVTDTTSKDYDKGWTTPKVMNPKSFFS